MKGLDERNGLFIASVVILASLDIIFGIDLQGRLRGALDIPAS